jgi:hypothetical protein
MTRYGRVGWRVAAVVAFAGTAALAVILTRAPISAQAARSPDVSCPTSGLQAQGVADYTLEFTNVSHRTCRLYGYPRSGIPGRTVP